MFLRILIRSHLKVIRQLKLRLRIALKRLEIHKQRVLDRKHGIVIDVLAITIKDLRDNRFIAGCGKLCTLLAFGNNQLACEGEGVYTYDKVNMRRPVRMSIQRLQYLPRRPVIRNRIRHRSQAIKIILPITPRSKSPSKIHLRLRLILLLIQPIRRRMPDVQHSALNGLPRAEIRDSAVHPRPIARVFEALDDGVAHGFLRGILAPEGAEDGGRGGFVCGGRGELVGYFVDEGFEAEDVAEELAFVAAVVGHAAGFVELCG